MHLFRSSMGDLVNAAFPIPDNPILLGTAQRTGITNLGDLVNAAFPLPQNPIMAATSLDRPKMLTPPDGRNALMRSLTAARTGPVSNDKGMGDAASVIQSTTDVLTDTVGVGGMDIPAWVLVGGAFLVLKFVFGSQKIAGSSRYYRAKQTAARLATAK